MASGCNLARSTVADYLGRARAAGLAWPLSPDLTEERLNELLFPAKKAAERPSKPPMAYLRDEMRRPSVTLQLLWEEYRKGTPDGYSYSQFCKIYHDWLRCQEYELAEWKRGMAHVDYHVELDGHHYSVPYTLIRQEVQIRYTRTSVEIFHKGQRVAVHARSSVRGGFTTLPEHRPTAHQKHLDWPPERLVSRAPKTGPNCQAVVRRIMEERRIPEHAFRPCLGVLRLGERYGRERLEQACFRALRLGVVTYRHIESTLKNGRDRLPLQEEEATPAVSHENIHGAGYYR